MANATVIATSDTSSTPVAETAAAISHKHGWPGAGTFNAAAPLLPGGVYTCDLSSAICTRKVVIDDPDNVLCSGDSCLVAKDESISNGGGIYLCDLLSGTCTLKVAVVYPSNIVCPTANNCIVSSDESAGSGGGIYACDLAAGTCIRKVVLDDVDFVTCPSGSSCIATQDEGPDGGAVYTCDLGTGQCSQPTPPFADLYGASGLFCFSATNCIVTADAPIDEESGYFGGVYACDLVAGTCDYKVELEWADFVTCTSQTSCLVTKEDSVQYGGGIYTCDLVADTCTLNAALDDASGIQVYVPAAAPVGGVVEQVKLPNLLAGWTIALAALAVMVVAFTYGRKQLTHQRKN
jgi:hypothetical protein